jgi:hypothetical protein
MSFSLATVFIFAAGFIIRMLLLNHNVDGFGRIQHDMGWGGFGHWDYIQYFKNNFALPPHNGGEAFQAPLHYIIMGVSAKIAQLFSLNEAYFCAAVVLFMNSILFITAKKTIQLFTDNKRSILIGLVLFVFFPHNIIISIFLNNDSTYYFFSVLAIYALCKWSKEHTIKAAIFAGFLASLSITAKVGGVILLPVCALIWLVSLIKKDIDFKKSLKQAGAFLLGLLPLVTLLYLHFHNIGQSLLYVVPDTSAAVENTFSTLFRFSIPKILAHPIGTRDNSLFEYLFQTSLFDEYDWSYTPQTASLLVSLAISGMTIMATFIISNFFIKKKRWLETLALPTYYLLSIIMMMKFCMDTHVTWRQHIRYIEPILLIYATQIALGFDNIQKNKLLAHIFEILIVIFAIISCVYVFTIKE